jgi:RNA polymerase sigma-70 factor (ECF subfamily)
MEAYNRFYKENRNRVFAYLLRLTGDYHLANDLMQESFARYLSRYGRNGDNCALLFTIARNAAIDAVRKCREKSIHEDSEPSPVSDPERQLIEKQAYNRMIAAIQRLNAVDRELIALLATETFSYKEIGKLLNISEANVKVKVHRARLKLKDILGNGGQ